MVGVLKTYSFLVNLPFDTIIYVLSFVQADFLHLQAQLISHKCFLDGQYYRKRGFSSENVTLFASNAVV